MIAVHWQIEVDYLRESLVRGFICAGMHRTVRISTDCPAIELDSNASSSPQSFAPIGGLLDSSVCEESQLPRTCLAENESLRKNPDQA
jgi:hypothetical protein